MTRPSSPTGRSATTSSAGSASSPSTTRSSAPTPTCSTDRPRDWTPRRDRFLFALLYDSGIRIGEALGMRHEDLAAAERTVTVQPRINDNGARSKSKMPRTIPVSAELIRLYADYLHGEYGDLDSDYLFVNLWAEPRGHALTYSAVYDLVRRLRRKTGIAFDPHWYRHTAATRMLRDGVAIEVVSRVLGHADISTTMDVYGHLTVEDARKAMEAAGWFADRRVQL